MADKCYHVVSKKKGTSCGYEHYNMLAENMGQAMKAFAMMYPENEVRAIAPVNEKMSGITIKLHMSSQMVCNTSRQIIYA